MLSSNVTTTLPLSACDSNESLWPSNELWDTEEADPIIATHRHIQMQANLVDMEPTQRERFIIKSPYFLFIPLDNYVVRATRHASRFTELVRRSTEAEVFDD